VISVIGDETWRIWGRRSRKRGERGSERRRLSKKTTKKPTESSHVLPFLW